MKSPCNKKCPLKDRILNVLAMPLIGMLALYTFILMWISDIKNKF